MKNVTLREELEKIINKYSKSGIGNKLVGEYMHAISLIISVSIPTGLLLMRYIDSDLTKSKLNFWILIISLISLVFGLLRTIFQFEEHSKRATEIKEIAKSLARKYDNNLIKEKQLIKAMDSLSIKIRNERFLV